MTTQPVGDDPVGSAAAELAGLARLPAEARRTVLERLLRHRSPSIRGAAIRIAATSLPVERVVGYLRDGEDHVLRNAGLEVLKARGRDGVALAEALLADRDPDVVLQAVLALDHIGDPRALESLRRALRHPNPNVVQAAIVAVGHHGHAAAVEDLLPFLGADLWLQAAAAEALGDLRQPAAVEPLAALLADAMAGPLAAGALARIGGPRAFGHLALRWLADDGADEELLGLLAHVAEGSVEPLAPCDGLVPALAARLASGGAVGQAAARCLLALGPSEHDRAAVELLAAAWSELLELPACLRRRSDLIGRLLRAHGAARAWGLRLAVREPAAVPADALADALDEQRGHECAEALAEALVAFGGADLGHRLITLYARLPRDVRSGWSAVLQRHRAELRAALGAADHPDPAARVIAAAVGTPGEAAATLEGLGAEDRLEALAHLADRADVLRGLPWLRWLREDAATYAGPAAQVARAADLQRFAAEIRDLAATVRHPQLFRLLGQLGDVRSVRLLIATAATGDASLRPVALLALGAIGGPVARRALREAALSVADGQRFAWHALAACRTRHDLPLFRDAAADRDWHVRMVAAEVLGASTSKRDRAALAGLAADPSAPVAERARAALAR